MTCPENNKDCVNHTNIAHGGTCPTSGKNACKDTLHNRTCWTEDEYRVLVKVAEHYLSSDYERV